MGYLVDFWLQTKTVVFDLSAADERMFVPSDFVCVATAKNGRDFICNLMIYYCFALFSLALISFSCCK